jgi:hypothetical protein
MVRMASIPRRPLPGRAVLAAPVIAFDLAVASGASAAK